MNNISPSNEANPINTLQTLFEQLNTARGNSRFKYKPFDKLEGKELSEIVLMQFDRNPDAAPVKIKEKTLWARLVLWVKQYTDPAYVKKHKLKDRDLQSLQTIFSTIDPTSLEKNPQASLNLRALQKGLNTLFAYIITQKK